MAEMNLKTARGFKLGTQRSEIKVPEKLRVKIATGVAWVDDALMGGFTPSTVGMLTGMPGAGKSTLVRQLADSISRTNQEAIVVYNSGEESLYQVQLTCERMGLQGDFMVGEESKCPDLVTFLKGIQKKNPKKHVILLQDSLQTLNDMKYKDGGTTGNTSVRCTEMLTDWAKETFGVALFIGQCTKSGDFAGKNTIKHAVDVHAMLYYDEDKKAETYGQLLFEVPKNRFGCSGKTYVVGITNKGIESRGSFAKGQDWNPGGDDDLEAEEPAS